MILPALKPKPILKWILKFSISFLALFIVFKKVSLPEVLDTWRNSQSLLLIPALILFVASKYFSARRLNMFFKADQIVLCEFSNLKLYLLGMYYNLILPGGVGGDGYKLVFIKKELKQTYRRALISLIADRVAGLVVLLMLVCLLSLILFQESYLRLISFFFLLFLLLSWVTLISFFLKRYKSIQFKTMLLSLSVQTTQLLCIWFLLQSMGVGFQSLPYLLLFLISSIAAAIPISLGGAGLRELTFLYGSGYFGINTQVAVAVSLSFFIITFLVSFAGIYFSFKPEKILSK